MDNTTVPTDRESQLIHRLAKLIPSAQLGGLSPGLSVGIGDDGAVLRGRSGTEQVVSCDASWEGIHFHGEKQPPESVGYKALARATSDLAAMGAIPSYFLLTLALPREKTGHWLDRFATGMGRAAREFGMRLIGGDISKASQVLMSITVLGKVKPGKAALRTGARHGDLIYVSGRLGGAQLGLEIVRRGLSDKPSLRKLVRPHFYPEIRLKLGQWLAEHVLASAMMDISDGLSMDLPRLCRASRAGARIFRDRVPRIQIPGQLANLNLDPLALALHGGEDYELLFTVPPELAPRLRSAPNASSLKNIGEITKARGILLINSKGTSSRLPAHGWDHFREPQLQTNGKRLK